MHAVAVDHEPAQRFFSCHGDVIKVGVRKVGEHVKLNDMVAQKRLLRTAQGGGHGSSEHYSKG
jgi:hypothetical protein